MTHMVGQVFEPYKIYFHDDKLTPEGISHNWALHVMLQHKKRMISQVLIDQGSGSNICPLNTLTKLVVDMAKIQTWKMNVRAFSGC